MTFKIATEHRFKYTTNKNENGDGDDHDVV